MDRITAAPGVAKLVTLQDVVDSLCCLSASIPQPPFAVLGDDHEIKNVVLCFWDEETEEVYQKEICRTYLNAVLVEEIIIWHLPDGSTSPTAPAANLVPCPSNGAKDEDIIEIPLCDPAN